MNQHFPEKMTGKSRVLVAPLDWGLGHATRCIPVIREFMSAGAEVWLAGEGSQESLLKEEFPGLPFLHLPGYRIRYAGSAAGLVWQLFRQLSKMHKAIQEEQQWLKKMVRDYGFDAVISDNRYGLYHSAVPSIIITHQLLIKTGWGKWTENLLQKKNYEYINRFTACWVPDSEGSQNLAGDLSHPLKMPDIPVRYTGWLSRFTKQDIPEQKNHLLFLLSGPEPQRSMLEKIIRAEIAYYDGTVTVVRGLPGQNPELPSDERIRFYNHLPSGALSKEMQEASLVICRSGYSSIMDAIALEKKSILIPTPGQTEQEYLGRSLMEKNIALSFSQKEFSLRTALEKAAVFKYTLLPANNAQRLAEAIRSTGNQVPALG